jgi:hypothetical protein
MKVFHCDHCGQLLFFENVTCVRCGHALAYVPELQRLVSMSPLSASAFKLCANYIYHDVCNWGLPEADPEALCRACRLTRTIPNLAVSGNIARWYKLETAKRRLVYTLDQLGLPLANKAENPATGLAFEFLEDAGAPVMTGHAAGVITMNIAEADDAERVRRRIELSEPYRTLLGHFRHESGHYYWDRLVAPTERLAAFRDLFGDERADYQAAVRRHYSEGAPAGWQDAHVSAYATMHPWEDWAETWAHYLHVVDTLETAAACGISMNPARRDEPTLANVPDPMSEHEVPFEEMMESWVPITYVLNMLNRGLGNPDAYPFVLSPKAIDKLRFVHDTISAHAKSA